MDGVTDLAWLQRFEQGFLPPVVALSRPKQGLLGPDGQAVDSKTLSRPVLAVRDCVDTPFTAHLRPAINRTYVIEPIIPTGKSTLVVGDSGIGKTPFLYQAGLSVAAGRTFLNMPVTQGPVLYIDWESSQEHSTKYQRELTTYLGFPKSAVLPFYVHGAWSPWPVASEHHPAQRIEALVRELRPTLVIFDCIRVLWPNAEKDNSSAQEMWNLHRVLQNTYGCSTVAVHHLRKAPVDSKTGRSARVKLQDDARDWLQNSAGTGALLNTCESRVGVALYKGKLDKNKTIVMGGFAKSDGDYDLLVAERVPNPQDPHGKPYGYTVNVALLQEQLPEEHRALFAALPPEFKHKDAVRQGQAMDISPTKADTILKALLQAQVVLKTERGYQKLKTL